MNASVKELIIDGITADKQNKFKGIGVSVSNASLDILADYKMKFPESYNEIIELLFKSGYGSQISTIKSENAASSAFFSDAKAAAPDISAENKKNDIKGKSGFCGTDLISAIRTTEKIVNTFSEPTVENGTFTFDKLISAEQPWSGYYEIAPGFWCALHITHFVEKGWQYIESSRSESECHTAFMSESGDYTIIFVNTSGSTLHYNVCVRNIEKSDHELYCVESGEPDEKENNASNRFRVIDKIIPARKAAGSYYRIDVKPNTILTCTTLSVDSVNGVDTVKKCNVLPRHIELPYSDSFNYSTEFLKTGKKTPLYTFGIHRPFEISEFENENVLEQAALPDSAAYGNDDGNVIVIGDKCWSNYYVRAEVRFGSGRECFAGIGLRYAFGEFVCRGNGYQLRIYPDGKWRFLYSDIIAEEGTEELIFAEDWNVLKIYAVNNVIRCSVNKQILCEHHLSEPMIPMGSAALFSSLSDTKFRNLCVNRIADMPYCCNHDGALSDKIKYGEGWSRKYCLDGQNAYFTETVNASFEYEFFGETISLSGEAEDLRLKIEIDDKIMTAGTVIEKSEPYQAFWYRYGLSDGRHKLKLIVLSGKLSLCGIATDEIAVKEKRTAFKVKKTELSDGHKKIKKSTLLIGAGLAAAGLGAFVLNKLFGRKKG
ncbi:MAG: hypothetical protein NC320_08095 [Clostridium sp.]|nr:hypothetical protein [Clostridium sp.]MCM1547826.1 hypothetical protein [Ruminococcus sp.]